MLVGHVFYSMYNGTEEVDFCTGNDNTDNVGAAGTERVRNPVTLVVHFLCFLLHQVTGFLAGALAVVEGTGNGSAGQIQRFGNICYGNFVVQ